MILETLVLISLLIMIEHCTVHLSPLNDIGIQQENSTTNNERHELQFSFRVDSDSVTFDQDS